MGKKGGSGINLKAALKVVNQLGNQLSAESTGDYSVALSALTAGQKNLSKQTRAFTRNMLLSQGQNQQALGALGARARAQSGVVSAKQAATTSRYGSALGASVAAQYKPAAAVAAGTGQVVTGQAKQGKGIGRVGETVAGIAQAGVAAQKQAAIYSMNQALQQRNIIDGQTLAALTGDLYKTAMSYNMQWDMWKRQQDYAAKQADKAGGTNMKAVANALTGEAPAIGREAWAAYDAAYTAAEGDTSQIVIGGPGGLAEQYATANGYAPDAPQVQLYIAGLQKMKASGVDPQDIDTTAVMSGAAQTLYGGMPGWDKYGSSITEAIASGTTVEFQAYYGPGGAGAVPDGVSPTNEAGVRREDTAGGTDAVVSDQESVNYQVANLRASGVDDARIREALAKAGYSGASIDKALAQARP
jgi:alkylhydroperoxidase family enzyme